MNYKIGNYYGEFKIRTNQDGTKEAYNIKVQKLKDNLCMGGYVWGDPVYFKTTQEAHDYIRKMNPEQRFGWKISWNGRECKTVDNPSEWDGVLSEVCEVATYQIVNGTDYLVGVCER